MFFKLINAVACISSFIVENILLSEYTTFLLSIQLMIVGFHSGAIMHKSTIHIHVKVFEGTQVLLSLE